MGNCILSVIVPVYNGQDYLSNIVQNILDKNKKISNWLEIIFVDDGSTDDSSDILDKLSEENSNITVLHKKNGGIASARDLGLKHSKGKFFSFMDQDDRLEKSYEDCLQKIISTEADMLIGDFQILRSDDILQVQKMGILSDLIVEGNDVRSLLCSFISKNISKDSRFKNINIHPSIWNCIFRRDCMLANQCKVFKFVDYEDDWLFLVQSLLVSKRIVLTNNFFYCWKENLTSESHSSKYISNLLEKKNNLKNWISNVLDQLSVNITAKNTVLYNFEGHSFLECFYNSSKNLSYKDYLNEISQIESLNVDHFSSINFGLIGNVFKILLLKHFYSLSYFINHYFGKRGFH